MIHRHVEMNLVATGAKLRRLLPHERFQKHAAMRLGIQLHQKIVQSTLHGILARRQFVQLGILEVEVALSHGAFHVGNGVAHHASQPGLRLGAMHDLFDRRIHQPAVEHRGIVAAAAPLGWLGADRVLHVLDALAIPLIVERRKMVHRTEPLVVDILVAALAGFRFHEELAGNLLAAIDLGRTGEKCAVRSVAFAVHAGRRHGRILNECPTQPARFAHIAGGKSESGKHYQADHDPRQRTTRA